MALSRFQEAQAVRRALTDAIHSALDSYLVEWDGQDLPEAQVILDDYAWEIQPLTKTSLMIRASHREHKISSLQIEVKVSGS